MNPWSFKKPVKRRAAHDIEVTLAPSRSATGDRSPPGDLGGPVCVLQPTDASDARIIRTPPFIMLLARSRNIIP
jgi:hypothetical protein